jgi:hypothetical protein
MAELKIPNLCGATPEFNAIQDKFESLISDAVDSLESEASALASSATSALNALESDLRSLIPELPSLPAINLQGQLTSLSGLIPGSAQHKTLLANITTKFGSALTAGGFSLDGLVLDAAAAIDAAAANAAAAIGAVAIDAASAITGGLNLCSAIPNIEVPAAGGPTVYKAKASKQAIKNSVEEKPSVIVKNVNLNASIDDIQTFVKKFDTEAEIKKAVDVVKGTITAKVIPTADIGAFTVSKEFKEITFPGGITKSLTAALQGLDKRLAAINKTAQPNVSSKGFARRPVIVSEEFKTTGTLTLKHAPSRIKSVQGYSTDYNDTYSILRGETERWVAGTKPVFIPAHGEGAQIRGGRELIDLWTVSGKTITISEKEYKWDGHPDTGVIFRISYVYFDTYDPNYVER